MNALEVQDVAGCIEMTLGRPMLPFLLDCRLQAKTSTWIEAFYLSASSASFFAGQQ
jgi:hypothetical protein